MKRHTRAIDVAVARSRPVRARGLKLTIDPLGKYVIGVAPRAGAWIETSTTPASRRCGASRPVRARGLKPLGEPLSVFVHGRAPCGRVD